MNDDIIRMAREAGLVREWMELCKKDEDALVRFASLAAAAEREACAKVCDDLADISGHYAIAATAIRKRGEK